MDMPLTAALHTVVTIAFSAAVPLFALAAYQYRDSPFGGVLLVFPLFFLLALATLSLEAIAITSGTQQALTLSFVGGASILALFGALRLFRLASGRRTV